MHGYSREQEHDFSTGPMGRPARRAHKSPIANERTWAIPDCRAWQEGISGAFAVLGVINGVLTSAFEGKRAAVVAQRVMRCGDEPSCVAVAISKGQRISMLIRDSHAFAVNLMAARVRLGVERLGPDDEGDVLDVFRTRTLATGSPVLVDAVAVIDCEVMRHFDLGSDHEMYVGRVLAGLAKPTVEGAAPGRDAGARVNGSKKGRSRETSRTVKTSRE